MTPEGEGFAMGIAPADDVVSLLTQDHAAVRQRLAEFESATPDTRSELFWKLTDALVRHEVAEESGLPSAARPAGRRGSGDARMAEEVSAERMLATMDDPDPLSDEFMSALSGLRDAVLDHAEREEDEAFPILLEHEASDRLVYVGQKFKGAKLAAPNHPHPHLPNGSTSRKVLGPIASFFDRMRDAVRSSA
jgi:Hemerythrin HHE cation binding domain